MISSVLMRRDASPEPRRKLSRGNKKTDGIVEEFTKSQQRQISSAIKSREELFQENMKLKKEVNRLNEELSILKGQLGARASRNSARHKQLDVEFEKPLYWAGSHAHLIAGIKHQYDKLRKQHQERANEVQKLKIAMMESKKPEEDVLMENLIIENERLVQKLRKLQRHAQPAMQNPTESEARAYLAQELEQKYEALHTRSQGLAADRARLESALLESKSKIDFLEKLIIEKDNREHQAGLKAKRAIKNREQAEQRLEAAQAHYEGALKNLDAQLKEANCAWENKLKQLEAKQMWELENREKKIKYLEEDQKKTEDAFNRMKMSVSGIAHNSLLKPPPASPLKPTRRPSAELNQVRQRSIFSQELNDEESEQPQADHGEPNQRLMQRADRKHSENSKKSRRVQHCEIEEAGLLIRLRAIAAGLDLAGVKDLFAKKKQETVNFLLAEEANEEKVPAEEPWEDTYITMAETMEVLIAHPLRLEYNEALLLARYIVEDCDEEYVFCDPGNENKRDVVKSIVKAITGPFELPSELVQSECQDFLAKYGANIGSVLHTYYPKGKISLKRFQDILSGVGANISERAKEYLSAKLAEVSTNLESLQFKGLFPHAE